MKHYLVPLIKSEDIEKRCAELGNEITKDYEGKDLKIIGILKGGAPFMCELLKHIDNEKLTIDFMSVSSYKDGTESSGDVRIVKDIDNPIEGENVIIVEDIVDSGNTLYKLRELLKTRMPNSIKICTLLDKPSRRKADIKSDYVGFVIEDKFVAGYGLDYAQLYRQLPAVYEVKFEGKENE